MIGQRQYQPPPEGPDPHEESWQISGDSPEGLRIIGARVRGVKHKHEGTHCDDWFNFDEAGPWTVIAVSDGAGSARYSRVGARAACKAAVQQLCDDLRDHTIEPRPPEPEVWNKALQRDASSWTFAGPDIEKVQEALHRAMLAAYDAVERAADERRDSPEHEAELSRKPALGDFSATLLLAVHATVRYGETDFSLVMTCQVGDGMMAAIDHRGGFQLLAQPDKGSYGGETVFLTDRAKLDRAGLTRKTFPFFSLRPMRALLVMTDGVADIYFPPDPEMLRLYGDLVLSGVIDLRVPGEAVAAALAGTSLPTRADVDGADYCEDGLALIRGDRIRFRLPFVTQYAALLGKAVREVVASPALLAAGARSDALGDVADPAERLRNWLDAYVVRGERDDRTLVALYREEMA
jgi:hypothetical protein